MGAPKGNCNACKSYRKSGAKKYLEKKMGAYKRRQKKWWTGSKTLAERKKFHGGFKVKRRKLK